MTSPYFTSCLCSRFALQQQGKLTEAVQEFKQAIKLAPDYVDAQNNLKKVQRQ
ncbi:tetratricopeptide repeat protein [Microcoleus sp. FACHB-831]|uniref:tetratricopeptide repeat protein n=1 Tax=Microcoleus sp. FACHB-831 TaxID=2692827 RepID=UPI001684F426|nr:tetratricopeptide repeat protein [Microcoleus sp. FACHB-831]MBD1920674.1 tetratricopeptide repeat protein [Microcoleus sp. FACHB-831]